VQLKVAEKLKGNGGEMGAGHIQISISALQESDSVFVQLLKSHRISAGV